MKIGIIQMKVTNNLETNINHALQLIREAAKQSEIVVLPEMFCCPYDNYLDLTLFKRTISTIQNCK